MAITYKVLGQINPSSNTATTVYTVPALTSTVLSTVTVCNQASVGATFRLAVRPSGESLAAKHYINYDTPVPANDTVSLTLGITLAATDVFTAYANSSSVSVNVFGSEIS
jgi:hypothetical protein